MKTKLVLSLRVESDAAPRYLVGSLSFGVLSVVTPRGDQVADMKTEHVEKVGSVLGRGTKRNLRKWVIKKH